MIMDDQAVEIHPNDVLVAARLRSELGDTLAHSNWPEVVHSAYRRVLRERDRQKIFRRRRTTNNRAAESTEVRCSKSRLLHVRQIRSGSPPEHAEKE